MSDERRVLVREPLQTEMVVTGDGQAKAFSRQLIRDGKGFECQPRGDGAWTFTVYEINYPNRWEAE